LAEPATPCHRVAPCFLQRNKTGDAWRPVARHRTLGSEHTRIPLTPNRGRSPPPDRHRPRTLRTPGKGPRRCPRSPKPLATIQATLPWRGPRGLCPVDHLSEPCPHRKDYVQAHPHPCLSRPPRPHQSPDTAIHVQLPRRSPSSQVTRCRRMRPTQRTRRCRRRRAQEREPSQRLWPKPSPLEGTKLPPALVGLWSPLPTTSSPPPPSESSEWSGPHG